MFIEYIITPLLETSSWVQELDMNSKCEVPKEVLLQIFGNQNLTEKDIKKYYTDTHG